MARFRRHSANRDPYWLSAKYASKCTCGKDIAKGDRIYYYPSTRSAVCDACGASGAAAMDDQMEHEARYSHILGDGGNDW